MTVLITGGTGFVGLGLAERLAEEGGADVILFGAAPPPEYLRHRLSLDRLRITLGDIRSASDINAACRGATIELVFHLAAVTAGPAKERDHPEQVLSVNIEGTAVLMKTLARYAHPRRIVVASSGSAYGYIAGDPDGRLNERTACPSPTSIYGISKLAGEGVALRLGELYGFDVRVVRLGTVYGPWEYPTDVREMMSPQRQILQSLAAGRVAILPRPMKTDWIYVRDVARGLIALVRAPVLDERLFNLGGGEVFDLLDWCRALAARRPGFSWRLAAPSEAANIRCNPPQDRAPLDSRRIAEVTGFVPAFDLARAADDYLAWFESLPPGCLSEAS